jgi:FkbM family methyltransferase
MKIYSTVKNLLDGFSDVPTFWEKILHPNMVSFTLCKNLRAFAKSEEGSKIDTIFDVGANEGQFAFMARYCWSLANIYCFEPDARAYERLTVNHNHDTKIICHNFALGEVAKNVALNLGSDSAQNSILTYNTCESIGQIEIPLKTLDELYSNSDLSNSLLKIDVQGYELQVLKGGISCLNYFSYILVEISFAPIFKNGPDLDEIWSFLKNHNYLYDRVMDQYKCPKTQKIVQMDILFRKQS